MPAYLLLLSMRLESLPRELPPEEVHHDVSHSLKVVSAGLFYSSVCVDGRIACGTCVVRCGI